MIYGYMDVDAIYEYGPGLVVKDVAMDTFMSTASWSFLFPFTLSMCSDKGEQGTGAGTKGGCRHPVSPEHHHHHPHHLHHLHHHVFYQHRGHYQWYLHYHQDDSYGHRHNHH